MVSDVISRKIRKETVGSSLNGTACTTAVKAKGHSAPSGSWCWVVPPASLLRFLESRHLGHKALGVSSLVLWVWDPQDNLIVVLTDVQILMRLFGLPSYSQSFLKNSI